MKRQDMVLIIAVAAFTALFAFVISSFAYPHPKNKGQTVPISEPITTSFPDVKNDPAYSSVFNSNSLDPAQPIPVGGSQNTNPFNGSQ